ncbi:MAG: GTP-binding protein [Promethearchaeota archaeon]|nr:MAG: GTP-binding protein [Candidatus Lokiarchaeota archaeon]
MAKKFIFKILLAGDGGVGKTTLLHRYIKGEFSQSTQMTIGVEFFLKEVQVDGQDCTLQLWDFGGQQRFRFLLESYVMGAKGALLMFDLTRPMTLENLNEWISICRKNDSELPILFVGTKLDLEEDISVDDDYAKNFLDQFDLLDYIKVSSKTGENVQEAFKLIADRVLERQSQKY